MYSQYICIIKVLTSVKGYANAYHREFCDLTHGVKRRLASAAYTLSCSAWG